MKIIFIGLVFSIAAFASELDTIEVKHKDGSTDHYSLEDYQVVKKKKEKPKDPYLSVYATKKFRLKSNSISFYMGRGPTHIYKVHNRDSENNTYYLGQSNLYGIGLSQRLGESFHLEMIGLSNETIMSGFKFEFGSP